MRRYSGPQAVAVTREEFNRRGGGGGGSPEDPGWLPQQLRRWAEKLLNREEKAIKEENAASLENFAANKFRLEELQKQFRRVADTSHEGTCEAVKVVAAYWGGLRTRQFA